MLPVLAALVAVVPGIYAWWTGRALLSRVEDPAFPELLLARMQRRAHIAASAAVVSTFIPGSELLWTLPLFAIALLVGGFPFRRALYGETWGVASYVRFAVFSFVGTAGFWLILAFAPFLILSIIDGWAAAAPMRVAVPLAAAFAVLLVAWDYAFPLVWLALHRASRLENIDLQSRFDEIIQRSSVSHWPPGVFRYGEPGAYVMNAFALPSVRQSRVAFGDTLLELMTRDEIVAVFAHEVAHLEHFDRRRMLRLRLLTYLLILGGTTVPVMHLALAPAYGWIVKLVWPIIVLTILALRATKSQAHETESDLRAATLTGDPESMVRALTKLHHYSRLPRRWPYNFEQVASHPSLAHRIQALRNTGSTAQAAPTIQLGAATVLRSTEPGAYAALDDKRAYWFDGVPADAAVGSIADLSERATRYRAVAYADLTELRVAVGRGAGRALLARDSTGKTWSMPLRVDDVAAAQQALDVLDVRLGNHVHENWATKARVIATLLALALVGALDFSWPWIPLVVTLAKPTKASLAAMGSMAIARVLLGAVAGTLGVAALGGTWPAAWLSVIATFAIGVWACRLAWRWSRGDERPTRQPFTILTLIILPLLLIAALAITNRYGSPAVNPLSLPTQTPSTAVALLLFGAGAALLTFRDSLRRRSGVAIAVVALVLGAFGVDGRRLLTGTTPGLTWTTGQAEVGGRLDLGSVGYRLAFSPGGRRIAVQTVGHRPARYEDDGDDRVAIRWTFTIASASGPHRSTRALDLAFVDDDHILALRPVETSGDSLELSLERADRDSASLWRRTIPAYYAPTLMLHRAAGMWRVTGHDVTAGVVAAVVGTIGSDSVNLTKVDASMAGSRPLHTYRDGTSLIATLHGSYGRGQMLLAAFGYYSFRWDLWHEVNGERRSAGALPGIPECGGRDETLLCIVRGRAGITLWELGRSSAFATIPVGSLPFELDLWDIGIDGRVAAASRDGSTLAVVDVDHRRGTRIELGDGGDGDGGDGIRLQGASASPMSYTADVAVGPGVLATLSVNGGKSVVTFYRVR